MITFYESERRKSIAPTNVKLDFLCHTPSIDFIEKSDNCFYVIEETRKENGELNYQEIVEYNLSFSNIERVVIHTEYVSTEVIINFGVDQMANRLIMYSYLPKLQEGFNYKVTLFDLTKNRIIFEQMVTNKELHGRLQSGLYIIIDGHIYYKNNVIKVRYDLIDKNQGMHLNEDMVFDYYYNIFKLNEGEQVMVGCPLDSKVNHRLFYIMRNPHHLKKARIMVLPYLHQKRLYLHR